MSLFRILWVWQVVRNDSIGPDERKLGALSYQDVHIVSSKSHGRRVVLANKYGRLNWRWRNMARGSLRQMRMWYSVGRDHLLAAR